MNSVFNYSVFRSLNGTLLHDYMEPLLANPETIVSKEIIERMFHELSNYDYYHIIYTLELGAIHSLEAILLQIPPYLTHSKGAVWCCAYRILDQLQPKFITPALIRSLYEIQAANPTNKTITGILDKLETRRRLEAGDL